MFVKIELNTAEVKALIINEIKRKAISGVFDLSKVSVKVRSKQNYKEQEWENGDIKATFEGDV